MTEKSAPNVFDLVSSTPDVGKNFKPVIPDDAVNASVRNEQGKYEKITDKGVRTGQSCDQCEKASAKTSDASEITEEKELEGTDDSEKPAEETPNEKIIEDLDGEGANVKSQSVIDATSSLADLKVDPRKILNKHPDIISKSSRRFFVTDARALPIVDQSGKLYKD